MVGIDEQQRRRFELAWNIGCPIPVNQCLPAPNHELYAATLLELVCIELEHRWKQWFQRQQTSPTETPPTYAQYIHEFPLLCRDSFRQQLIDEQNRLCRRFAVPGHPSDGGSQSTRPSIGEEDMMVIRPEIRLPGDRPEPPAESASSTVIGDYRLLELLGQGGMGAVYKARHQQLGRVVALKILRTDRLHTHDAVARFKREIMAIGGLPYHPNIVLATDARQIDGQHVLVMEFLDGLDLARLVAKHGSLKLGDACDLARQAAEALAHIAAYHLVHRDIKPSNLLLTSDGVLRVLDLGLARIVPGSLERLTELTAEGELIGTPDFMAPEQWIDSRHVDSRTDLYSLGCTLFYLLSGKAPFGDIPRDALLAKQQAHLKAPVPRLSAYRPDIPESLQTLLSELMSKAVVDRPQHPEVVAERLGKFCRGAELQKLISSVSGDSREEGRSELSDCNSTFIADCHNIADQKSAKQASAGNSGSILSTGSSNQERVYCLSLQVVGTPFIYTAPAEMQVITVGRQRRRAGISEKEGCDFVIRLPNSDERNLRISRQHFRIRRSDGGYVLQNQSKTGTCLNGRRLLLGEESRVQPGDRILVADLVEICVVSDSGGLPVFQKGSPISAQPGGKCKQLILEVSLGDLKTREPANESR